MLGCAFEEENVMCDVMVGEAVHERALSDDPSSICLVKECQGLEELESLGMSYIYTQLGFWKELMRWH